MFQLRLSLILALCALLARPAQAQAEPVAASSDSLSEQPWLEWSDWTEVYGTSGTGKYTETELRITKKVVAGTASGVVFAVLGGYSDDRA